MVVFTGWLFASSCSPPRLSATQLLSATKGSASPPVGTFTQLLECARGRTSGGVPAAGKDPRPWGHGRYNSRCYEPVVSAPSPNDPGRVSCPLSHQRRAASFEAEKRAKKIPEQSSKSGEPNYRRCVFCSGGVPAAGKDPRPWGHGRCNRSVGTAGRRCYRGTQHL